LSLRGAALMPAAALAVHELRYKLAFGGGSSEALSAQGHAYLSSLVPWIVLLAALSVGATLGRLVRRWVAGPDGLPGRMAGVRVWLVAASALFAVYTGQELLEGVFATGHLGGLAAVFGAGGWWAVPAALLVGGVLALGLRGTRVVERVLDAARPFVRVAARGLDGLLWRATSASFVAIVAPLARVGAGRAPPRSLAALV
jgi:hypothetical protein